MVSEEVKAQMREIVARYPSPRSGMLPCLHLVQETEGYVTPEGIQAVAEAVGAKVDEVESVVTFYSMYRRAPAGKHVIKVCTSISCYLGGCDELLAHLENRLGIARGQTTPDGQFTLQGVECLAACGMAPALQVNDQFVEYVTPAKADALLDRLRAGGSVEARRGEWNVLAESAAATGADEGAAAANGQGSTQRGKAR
jgi:NADH-quinone oxidoreductase E subunit